MEAEEMTPVTAEPEARRCLTDQEWQASNITKALPTRATLTARMVGRRERQLMTTSTAEPEAIDRLTDQDWRASNITSTLPDRATLTVGTAGRREFRIQFDGEQLVIGIVHPPAWAEPMVQSLGKLLQLEPDWDTYGGSPIDPMCVVAALKLALEVLPDDMPVPSVVPTSRGGLQLEWHTRGVDLEVEFLSATRVCGLFEDADSGTWWEEDLSSDLRPLAEAISKLSKRR
jgi:hypothetical protein